MRYHALFGIMLLALLSCTEEMPIAPEYTADTNWAPALNLIGSGYERFGIRIESPPRLELARNVSRYVLEYQGPGSPAFLSFDILDIGRFFPEQYLSAPRLRQGADYALRLAVEYRNGVARRSEVLTFSSPMVKGKVLQRQSLDTPEIAHALLRGFGFSQGNLYALKDEYLVRYDLATGQSRVLASDLRPQDQTEATYTNVAFHENALILPEYTGGGAPLYLYRYDLIAGAIEQSWSLQPPPGAQPVGPLAYNGTEVFIVYFFGFGPGAQQQLIRFNTSTGRTTVIDSRLGTEFFSLLAVGNDLWTNHALGLFDYRIRKFEAQDFAVLEEHRNPVFNSVYLAWDGSHFWLYESESNSVFKIQLEGL